MRVATKFVEARSQGPTEVLRAWEDGRHVFIHGRKGPKGNDAGRVTADFFELEDDGTIVQRWSVCSELQRPNPSGRTQVDGATEFADVERTEANKALVTAMVRDCLFPGARAERIEDFFAEEYIQHNPSVGDGLDIVRKLAQAEKPPLVYDDIVLVVGSGNFVAILCTAKWEGAPLTQVDILRLEEGKIVEHWDLSQPAAS